MYYKLVVAGENHLIFYRSQGQGGLVCALTTHAGERARDDAGWKL